MQRHALLNARTVIEVPTWWIIDLYRAKTRKLQARVNSSRSIVLSSRQTNVRHRPVPSHEICTAHRETMHTLLLRWHEWIIDTLGWQESFIVLLGKFQFYVPFRSE